MFDPKKEITEDNSFFNNLFENAEKEQDEELYKKNLYVLKEDLDSRKDENSIKFMHDVLLSKLILEDYPMNNHITFNSKQLEYLIMLKKVFSERKHVELKDLTEEPLGEGKRLFETVDLINIINTCNTIKMC